MRTSFLTTTAVFLLLGATLSPSAHAAKKLKGFYAGSGGTPQRHRTFFIEFALDGTAILQQKWNDKDLETWHAQWKQQRSQVTITFDPARHNPVPDPLVLDIKHGTLVPTSWDATAVGALGPPKLTPFGGQNPQAGSVAGCQSLNTLDPRRDCVTWGTNR
jgi:hypothetical protein